MPEVLVVCTANICRSPVVEAILRARLEERGSGRQRQRDWRVTSAGTLAFPGFGAAEHSGAVMAELRFDLNGHRSQRTDERRMAAADLVLCMEPEHKRALRAEFPHHRHKVYLLTEMIGEEREVEDPIGGPRAGYERMVEEVSGLVERGLPRIVELATAHAEGQDLPEILVKAIRFHRHGGPEVLRLDDVPVPEPAAGEVRVRLAAAGVNFIDTYLRSGSYPAGPLPAIAGKEGGGVVDAVGPEVDGIAEGDRVVFFSAAGSYAEQVVVPAARAVPVPRDVEMPTAVALTLQGMTAHYLTQSIRPVGSGDRVLIHAAAGGVGLLAIQMARLFGAEVFGTCSTAEKAERARAAGADHVILYTETDFADEVLRRTGGEGVDLVIDGVGLGTFLGSVRATRVRGHVILFGQASGEPEPIRPRAVLGSRTLTCASLFDYSRDREEVLARAQAVFTWHRIGKLDVRVDRVLPLVEAAEAHRLLEGRQTSGKLLLKP